MTLSSTSSPHGKRLATDENPATPRKKNKFLYINTDLDQLASGVNTSDTEDDCSGYSPITPDLFERVGLGRNGDKYTKHASQQDADTTLAPQVLETEADVALHLGLKVKKRDDVLVVSKKKIQRLKGYLRDGADREARLKAELKALREQNSNWKRSSRIAKAILDNAEQFPTSSDKTQ